MSQNPPIKKFRVKHVKSKDHKTLYADGALVGTPAANSIIMDFFVGNFLPVDEFYTWSDDKKTFDIKLETSEVAPYERVLQVEVVMTPENAQIFANSILEKVKAFKGINQ